MENSFRLSQKFIVLVLLFLFYSCNQDETTSSELLTNDSQSLTAKLSKDNIIQFKGPETTLGYGKVRSWLKVNKESGKPDEIGIEFTADAFKNLTTDHDAKTLPSEGSTIVVPLHLKAKELTPFDHIGLNWNPHGHPPPGVFDAPHFDVHFYMISVEEQLAIPEWSPATNAAFNFYPPADYLPADYGTPPGPATAEGEMGKHWAPINMGPFLPFTKIMIYGTFNGKVNFIEPMITLDYFLSKPNFSEAYSQPVSFQKAGYYPTKYNIYYDWATGNTNVSLSEFVWRTPPSPL